MTEREKKRESEEGELYSSEERNIREIEDAVV